MGHAPVLIPDNSLWFQLGLFVASFFVLRAFLFRPYRRLQEMRRAKTSGLQDVVASSRERSLTLKASYEKQLGEERKKIHSYVEEERKKIDEEQRQIVQAARARVTATMETSHKQLEKELAEARKELAPRIGEFSTLIVKKLLASTRSGSRSTKTSASQEELVRQP